MDSMFIYKQLFEILSYCTKGLQAIMLDFQFFFPIAQKKKKNPWFYYRKVFLYVTAKPWIWNKLSHDRFLQKINSGHFFKFAVLAQIYRFSLNDFIWIDSPTNSLYHFRVCTHSDLFSFFLWIAWTKKIRKFQKTLVLSLIP